MKHVIIGTAGHVDHGKTTLIKRLTGIDTDRLLEEKKRGITIELGFAYMTNELGEKIGIVDVPGHEKFIRHMLAGAGGIDIALLIVDANEGVMPQTREHTAILDLLGVKKGVVVITKADTVDADWLPMVVEDIKEELRETFLKDAEIIPVSAITGEGIGKLCLAIWALADECAEKNANKFARLPIDRVFTMKGAGTVITGTLTQGKIENGQNICIYPKQIVAKVRNVEVHETPVETAYAGQRVAINLSGVKKEEIDRGDCIASPESMTNTPSCYVQIKMLPKTDRTIKNRSRVHFYSGTSQTIAVVTLLNKTIVKAGESAFAKLTFSKEIPLCHKDRFILRFFSPLETLGGGEVLIPSPVKLQKQNAIETLEALFTENREQAIGEFIKIYSPLYKKIDFYKHLTGFTDDETAKALKKLKSKSITLINDEFPLNSEYLKQCTERIKVFLTEFHEQNPLKEGIALETFKNKTFTNIDEGTIEALLSYLSSKKVITVTDTVKLSSFSLNLSNEQSDISNKIETIYLEAKFNPPVKTEVLEAVGNNKSAQAVFDSMVKSGKIKHINGLVFVHKDIYERALEILKEYLKDNEGISLAAYRDITESSRKIALLLLEHFDSKKITRKKGDIRILY